MDRRENDKKIEELVKEFKNHINTDTIDMANINQQIRNMLLILTNHIEKEDEEIRNINKNFNDKIDELILTMKPIVDIYNKSNGFFETLTWVFKTAAIVSAGVMAILYLMKLGK